jgi:DNA adenine methylase
MVGSGALFFALAPKRAVLSDSNNALILAYHHVMHSPSEITGYLHDWFDAPYAAMRQYYRAAIVSGLDTHSVQAARFIWLNHMNFNGLYRVNKAGVFNVPKGSRTKLPEGLPDAVLAASKILHGVDLKLAGYEDVIHTATAHDFVYFDPPYLSEKNGFTAYTEDDFDLGEHARLRWVCGKLDKLGCPWMLSSSDYPVIRELYKGYDITEVQAKRMINSDGNGRGPVQELVIRNY